MEIKNQNKLTQTPHKNNNLNPPTPIYPPLDSDFTRKYDIEFLIGWGGFGTVAKVKSKENVILSLACKFIPKSKVSSINLEPGTNVPKEFKHENIISFYDFYQDHKYFYLVTECHGEIKSTSNSSKTKRPVIDLFEYIEINICLSETTARKIFKQIMSAISYIHVKGFVHGDVKDENILIDEDGKVKLIDFGSASRYGRKKFNRFLGTIQYASPEILRGENYDGPAAEVWALGCCLYTMLTGQIPFRSKRHALLSSFFPPVRPLSYNSNDLLLKMLEKDPNLRCSVPDILSHDWLAETNL